MLPLLSLASDSVSYVYLRSEEPDFLYLLLTSCGVSVAGNRSLDFELQIIQINLEPLCCVGGKYRNEKPYDSNICTKGYETHSRTPVLDERQRFYF